jgi:hypothetical protein
VSESNTFVHASQGVMENNLQSDKTPRIEIPNKNATLIMTVVYCNKNQKSNDFEIP